MPYLVFAGDFVRFYCFSKRIQDETEEARGCNQPKQNNFRYSHSFISLNFLYLSLKLYRLNIRRAERETYRGRASGRARDVKQERRNNRHYQDQYGRHSPQAIRRRYSIHIQISFRIDNSVDKLAIRSHLFSSLLRRFLFCLVLCRVPKDCGEFYDSRKEWILWQYSVPQVPSHETKQTFMDFDRPYLQE